MNGLSESLAMADTVVSWIHSGQESNSLYLWIILQQIYRIVREQGYQPVSELQYKKQTGGDHYDIYQVP